MCIRDRTDTEDGQSSSTTDTEDGQSSSKSNTQKGRTIKQYDRHRGRTIKQYDRHRGRTVKQSARTHVLMFEGGQHAQLPVHPFAGDEVLEDVGHLLQSHPFPVPRVRHGPAQNSDVPGYTG